jgi:flagellar biosynthesis protein FlhF
VAEHVADSLLRGDDPTADLSTLVASAVRCHGPILRDRAAGGVPVHVVVGPTGVGKTTLIAKLAAEAVLERREHVALITIDTYRVNAVEHLRRYADILDVPFEVAATPTALREALLRHQDRDHVLVDTDGRGPRDAPRLDELGHFVRTGGPMEVHLVLSATTSGTEMLAAARAFASTRPASTVFTKLDEASRLGEILNYLAASHAAVSLLGHGPRTPGNLEVATPERLTRLILQLDPVPPAEVPATGASR